MSSHGEYLNDFYVHPSARGYGHGKLLMEALLDLLRERKIAYLSTLVAEHDPNLSRYFESGWLAVEKTYWWLERFGNEPLPYFLAEEAYSNVRRFG